MKYRAPGQSRTFDKATGVINVSVRVKNAGSRAGSETVLFFTFDESRHTTPEYKRLRRFEKIYLKPGEEKVVTATLSLADPDFLSVGPYDDSHLVIQNGMRFKVGVGADTDCRDPNNDYDPDPASPLCSEFVTIDTGDDYSSACDAACKVWSESGCAGTYSLSPKTCWDMCKYSGQGNVDGW
jgi:beta-glucosidase